MGATRLPGAIRRMASRIEGLLAEMNGQATKEAIADVMGENLNVINEALSWMAKEGKVGISGNMVTLK